MDTTITQVEWMGRATTDDNDAIDADMHARAGDAELILKATQRQSAVMMVVCYSGATATAGAAERVLAVAAVVICQWLQHVRLWLAVGGFGLGIWRVRFLGCASWKQFSRLQKAFCFCEKLTLLHLVPVDEAPATSSMLRAVCVLCCCVRE